MVIADEIEGLRARKPCRQDPGTGSDIRLVRARRNIIEPEDAEETEDDIAGGQTADQKQPPVFFHVREILAEDSKWRGNIAGLGAAVGPGRSAD